MGLTTDKKTIGELLYELRMQDSRLAAHLSKVLKISHTTYLSVERGQRELSFLMALRICQFYKLDIHEFISRLSEEELDRPDRSVLRQWEKIEKRKKEKQEQQKIGKVIAIQDRKTIE